ncbi:Isochorismatase hydrolase [Hypoxylon trugodes]|uniref:Isochorismatase hydrolase n=1 Tax=Hypoxylon trugodes TaxID=326681 RepID=UPI0021A1C2C1|nr:Isochorismatase hydrolase [Hypoxylon trugodes]KAI1392979.1 Isochorismatase hydrolase [Hypoxylon trugodes]
MPPILKLGPKGDEWAYDRGAKSYDLTRGDSSPGLTLRTTQGPTDTSLTVAPKLTALVVVDMQNFFLHPRCNDHPTGLHAAQRILEVVNKCREVGIKIIWLNWGLNDSDLGAMPAAAERSFASGLITPPLDNKQARNGFGSDMGEGRGRLLMKGSWNAKLYDPLYDASQPDVDISCNKDRISGFWNGDTEFAKALAVGGFRTLLFTGVNTDQCVLGTLTDAYYRGWDCIMLEDCCATKTPGGQEVTIHNTSRGYGFVTDSRSFIEDACR